MIKEERERQLLKWGDQTDRTLCEWMSILMEEVGELAEAANETYFDTKYRKPEKGGRVAIMSEAIQVAAVAAAIVEAQIKKKALTERA